MAKPCDQVLGIIRDYKTVATHNDEGWNLSGIKYKLELTCSF